MWHVKWMLTTHTHTDIYNRNESIKHCLGIIINNNNEEKKEERKESMCVRW